MTTPARPSSPPSKLTPLIAQAAAPDLNEVALPEAPSSQTPQLLRRYQLVAVIALLVFGLVAIAATVQLRSDLTQGPGIVDQYARLGSVHSELLAAGNAAARNVLSASAEDRKEVSAHLDDANQVILQAAAARPQDADQLAILSTKLIAYDRLLYTATTTSDPTAATAALRQADQLLDSQLIPAISALRDRLTADAAAGAWPGWGWVLAAAALAALAALVTISVGTAQITHRYLNRGLVGAVLAAILLTVLGAMAISRADTALDLNHSVELKTTMSIASARAGLNAADRLQLRGAVDRRWSSRDSETVTTTSGPAESTAIDDPAMQDSIDAVRRAQSTINGLLERNDWTQANSRLTAAKGIRAKLATFEKAAAGQTQHAATAAAQALDTTAVLMVILAIVETLLLLGGLALAMWGLDRVLREYR